MKLIKQGTLLLLLTINLACNNSFIENNNPNIIIILADDMGYGDPTCFNPNSKINTTHLDLLAKGGMRFTDAHAAAAWCIPSRYALLTGVYPFRNKRIYKEGIIKPGQETLATLLRASGYQTAMVGKWHLGIENEKQPSAEKDLEGGPLDHGFDSFFGIPASLDIPPYYLIRDRQLVEPLSDTIPSRLGWAPPQQDWKIQGPFYTGGKISKSYKHGDILNQFGEESIAYIKKASNNKELPFFLYLALPAPHTPWLPDEAHEGKSEAGSYGDYVLQVDDWVGEIMTTLKSQKIDKNTLVIFTSDNGPVWYPEDYQQYGHDAVGALSGMKGDALEGGHRMPFIAYWPKKIPSNTSSDQLIVFTDVYDTLLDLLGRKEEMERTMDSQSFYPSLLDNQIKSSRNSFVIESVRKAYTYRKENWKLILSKGPAGFSEIYDTSLAKQNPFEGQLYNLENDLGEQTNLFGKEKEKVRELRAEWEVLNAVLPK